MATKKVGGPARKLICSRATSRNASAGSNRRTSTARMPAAPGTRIPLSTPAMCAIGAGMRTASREPRPWTPAISVAFQLRPRWVWRTALGVPVEPEVKRMTARSDGRTPLVPTGTG